MEVVAGSKAELTLVNSLRDLLALKGFDVRVTPIEVVEWSEVACSINGLPCTAQPPIDSGCTTGTLGRDVLLSPTTEDPDNVWVIYSRAARGGYSAVVLYDSYPQVRRRRIVVNEFPSYSLSSKIRAKIPAVHVPASYLNSLRNLGRLNICVETAKRLSTGYILDATLGEEPRVAVVVHHDRWLAGFRDDTIGVLTALKVAEYAREAGVPIRLISFTAEEYGDPSESSLYWAYGSRRYSERVEDLDLALVIDTAFTEPVEVDAVGLTLSEGSLEHVSTRTSGLGMGYTDALSLVKRGVPTVVLHNIQEIKPYYHADIDTYPGREADEFVDRLARSVVRLASRTGSEDFKSMYRTYVSRLLTSQPPRVRLETPSISDPIKYSKCLIKFLVVPAVRGSYLDLNSEIETLSYFDILRRVGEGARYTILGTDEEVGPDKLSNLESTLVELFEDVARCYRG
jgi:Iap family predicted aminopeptidase